MLGQQSLFPAEVPVHEFRHWGYRSELKPGAIDRSFPSRTASAIRSGMVNPQLNMARHAFSIEDNKVTPMNAAPGDTIRHDVFVGGAHKDQDTRKLNFPEFSKKSKSPYIDEGKIGTADADQLQKMLLAIKDGIDANSSDYPLAAQQLDSVLSLKSTNKQQFLDEARDVAMQWASVYDNLGFFGGGYGDVNAANTAYGLWANGALGTSESANMQLLAWACNQTQQMAQAGTDNTFITNFTMLEGYYPKANGGAGAFPANLMEDVSNVYDNFVALQTAAPSVLQAIADELNATGKPGATVAGFPAVNGSAPPSLYATNVGKQFDVNSWNAGVIAAYGEAVTKVRVAYLTYVQKAPTCTTYCECNPTANVCQQGQTNIEEIVIGGSLVAAAGLLLWSWL